MSADRTCAACGDGTFTKLPNQTACADWTAYCAAGTFQKSAPSAKSDRLCAPCGKGAYSDVANIAASCRAWTSCSPGQYVSVAGTRTGDRACTPCEEGSFSKAANQSRCTAYQGCRVGAEYEKTPGTARSAPSCKKVTTCKPGTFVASPATVASDSVCQPCPTGTYTTEANQTTCREATVCTSAQFQKSAASGKADRVCVDAKGCGETEFEKKPPTATSDRVCAPVSGTKCATGSYRSGTACVPCPDGQVCSGGAAPARAATVCKPGTYAAVPAGKGSDTVCKAATVCTGSQYMDSDATGSTDRVCRALKVCKAATEYEMTRPSQDAATGKFTSDRVCAALTDCSDGQYESTPATATSDRGCSTLTTCQSGRFVKIRPTKNAAGDNKTDRLCDDCPAGSWSTGSNATTCTAGLAADPCSNSNGGCLPDATCTNAGGSVSCGCKPGYTGDGKLSCEDTTAPADPVGVTATATSTAITLSWVAVSDPDGSGFKEYRVALGPAPTPPACSAGVATTSTTATVMGLTSGVTYAYRICSVDKGGTVSSGSTDLVSTPSCTAVGHCAAGATCASVNDLSICVRCDAGYVGTGTSTCTAIDCDDGQKWNGTACVSCEAGKWSTGGTVTTCSAWTDCVAGEHVLTEGDNTQNRMCEACAAGTFSTSTNAPACTDLRTCADGTYVSSQGSKVADRTCSPCASVAHCAAGTTCTSPSDATCSTCDAGWVGATCSQTATAACHEHGTMVAGVCQCLSGWGGATCDVATSCPAGFSLSGGACHECADGKWSDAGTATSCSDWTECVAGEFVSTAGDKAKDRECSPCPEGKFSTTGNAPACDVLRTCGTGTYVAAAGSKVADRTCSPCASVAHCAAGTTCSGSTDATCSACDNGWVGADCSQTASEACSNHGTLVAGSCACSAGWGGATCNSAASCAAGKFLSGGACVNCPEGQWSNGGDATACTDWTDCVAGEAVSSAGDKSKDRVCSACGIGTYSSTTNAAACTACGAGTFAAAAGATSCETCGSGTYAVTTGATGCLPMTICQAGSLVQTDGSAIGNRVCGDCDAGRYSLGTNATACVAWDSCGAAEYETTAGTSVSNRACAACTSIDNCASGLTCTTSTNQKCATCAAGYTGNATASCEDTTAPNNTTSIGSSNVAQSSMTVSWTAAVDVNTGSRVKEYRVVSAAGEAPGDCTAGYTTVVGSSTSLTGLTANTSYGVRVCTVDNANNVSGGASQSLSTAGCAAIANCGSGLTCSTSSDQTCGSCAAGYSGNGTPNCADGSAPANPTGMTSSSTQSTVALNWLAVSDPDGAGLKQYQVVIGVGPTAPACSAAGATTATGANFSALTPNTSYAYRVCSVDNAGNVSSGTTGLVTTPACNAITNCSSGLTCSTANDQTCGTCANGYSGNGTAACADTTAPNNVATPTTSSVTQSTMTVSWTAATDVNTGSGVTEYRVAYAIGTAPGHCTGGFVSSATTSIGLTALAPGSNYGLRVCTVDAAGNVSSGTTASASTLACTAIANCGSGLTCTTASNQTCGTCASGYSGSGTATCSDTTAPDNVTNLTKSASALTSMTIGWTSAGDLNVGSGTKEYRLVYSAGSAPANCSSGFIVASTTSASLSSLTANTNYGVRVCTVDNAGNVSAGTTATLSTDACTTIPNCASGLTCTTSSNQTCTTCASGYAGSGTATCADTTAPNNVTGISSPSKTATTMTLSWNAATDVNTGSGVKEYRIVKAAGTAPSNCSTSYTTTATNEATITGLSPNTAYGIRVCAVDNSNNVSTGAATTITSGACTAIANCSTGLTCTTDTNQTCTTCATGYTGNGTSACTDVTAPANPGSASTSGATQAGITVTWGTVTDASGSLLKEYRIAYAPTTAPANCSGTYVSVPAGTTTKALTGLQPGNLYGFRVCAVDNALNVSAGRTASGTTTACTAIANCAVVTCTTASNQTCSACRSGYTASGSTSCVDVTAPSDPAAVTASGASAFGMTVVWPAATDASTGSGVTGYRYVYATGAIPTDCSAYLSTTNTFFDFPNLQPSTAYGVRVCSVDAAGNVSPGMTASLSTLPVCQPLSNCNTTACSAAGVASCLVCSSGYAGSTCQYTRSAQCNSHGTVQNDGSCVCDVGWDGATCNACRTGFTGSSCVAIACPNNQYWNGSSCTARAGADCPVNWYFDGLTCQICGLSSWSPGGASTTCSDFTPPILPHIVVKHDAASVTVQWSGSKDAVATVSKYRISAAPGIVPPEDCSRYTDETTSTSYTVANLRRGDRYAVRVCPVDSNGNVSTGIAVHSGACETGYFATANGCIADSVAPSALTGQTKGVKVGAGTVRLDISPGSDTGSGVSYYKVAVSPNWGAPSNCNTPALESNGSTVIYKGDVTAPAFSFKVCPVDAAGNEGPGLDVNVGAGPVCPTGSYATTSGTSTCVSDTIAPSNPNSISVTATTGSMSFPGLGTPSWPTDTGGAEVATQWMAGAIGTTAPASCQSTDVVLAQSANSPWNPRPGTDYSFRRCAVDNAGNVSTGVVGTVRVPCNAGYVATGTGCTGAADTTPPSSPYTPVFTVGTNSLAMNGGTNWSSADAGIGVDREVFSFSASGTPASCLTAPNVSYYTGITSIISSLSEGTTYYWKGCTLDQAGNTSTMTTGSVTTLCSVGYPTGSGCGAGDTVAPVFASNGSNTSGYGSFISWRNTADDLGGSGVVKSRMRMNDKTETTVSNCVGAQVEARSTYVPFAPSLGLSDGMAYSVGMCIVDAAGNSTFSSTSTTPTCMRTGYTPNQWGCFHTQCNPGYYWNGTGCTACGTGLSSEGGRNVPSCRASCAVGQYWDGQLCQNCPSGQTSIGGYVRACTSTYTYSGQSFEFAQIPAGKFKRGFGFSETAVAAADRPLHFTTISKPFLILSTELTQAQWLALTGLDPSVSKGSAKPVENVSWYDAVLALNAWSTSAGFSPVYTVSGTCTIGGTQTGCTATQNLALNGFRLPTEAEWEYAARAGQTSELYGTLVSSTWYTTTSGGVTQTARTLLPNAFGLYGVLGNVAEWTSDINGTYTATDKIDPLVSTSVSTSALTRGGGYSSAATLTYLGKRGVATTTTTRSGLNGLRPVRVP